MDLAAEALAQLGLSLEEPALEQLERLREDLQRESQAFNLTALRETEEIQRKHFLDSLALLWAEEPASAERLCDIGSGAGFPGLPLAIVRPELRIDLLEGTRKKAAFLEREVERLGLKSVRVVPERSEVWARGEGRGLYDLVVARAVAPLDRLLGYAWPLLRPGGRLWALKGPKAPEEVAAAASRALALGAEPAEVKHLVLEGVGERYLVRYRRPLAGGPTGIRELASKTPETTGKSRV